MYQIKVKDDSTKERIIVICPSAISVKEWLFTQLLHEMRKDVAIDETLSTMREIITFYATQLMNLDDFDMDLIISTVVVETYHGVKYVIDYYVEPLNTVDESCPN